MRFVEPDPKPLEQLLAAIGASAARVLGPQLAQAWLPIGTPPALAREAQRDLLWLNELSEARQPFAAVVHCLCDAP